jgi:hypothetical protein
VVRTNEEKRREVMRTIVKRTIKVMLVIPALLIIFVLIILTRVVYWEYTNRSSAEELNDVMLSLRRSRAPGNVTYIEQKNTSTGDRDVTTYDIYVLNGWWVLQMCRIKNGALQNFRSLNALDLSDYTGEAMYPTTYKIIEQLPNNMLQQDKLPSNFPTDTPITTIINMSIPRDWGKPIPADIAIWGGDWWIRRWTGTFSEVPIAVEAFCQRMIQVESSNSGWCADLFKNTSHWFTARTVAALPDIRDYPAYLRAIPLFTEEALEAEKDTPLIALEEARQNVHYAVQYPYIFFPIPPKRSPFPTARKYTAGDKFRVNYEGGCFLIETFVNESLK